MPGITTRLDPVSVAVLGYMGTHNVPMTPEAFRQALEDVYRLGCRDTLRQTAVFSQVTQTAQQSLVASQHLLTLLRLIAEENA